MQYFFAAEIIGDHLTLSQEESQHCIKVLRLQNGNVIILTDGRGHLYEARIENALPKKCEVKILKELENAGKRNFNIHIAVAPTKNISRMEWFLEKATEVGIDEITPIICEHSERKEIKAERLEKVIVSAAKQSLKAYFPKLNQALSFKQFISVDFTAQKFIAFLDKENNPSIKSIYDQGKNAIVLIGPEGDFSNDEIESAKIAGFKPINLGESRLRTETAALYSCFMIHCLNNS